MVFAPSLPYPTVFFASVKEIASRHREQLAYGRKTINVSFVEFKGQDTFFVRELAEAERPRKPLRDI